MTSNSLFNKIPGTFLDDVQLCKNLLYNGTQCANCSKYLLHIITVGADRHKRRYVLVNNGTINQPSYQLEFVKNEDVSNAIRTDPCTNLLNKIPTMTPVTHELSNLNPNFKDSLSLKQDREGTSLSDVDYEHMKMRSAGYISEHHADHRGPIYCSYMFRFGYYLQHFPANDMSH